MNKLFLVFAFLLVGCTSEPLTLPSGGDLDGTWMGDCSVGGGSAEIGQVAVDPDSTAFSTVDLWFGGTSCSGVSHLTVGVSQSLTIGALHALGNGDQVTKVDMLALQFTATPNDQGTTDLLNLAGFFGISDWALGQTRDITGLDATTGAYTAPVVEKEILAIDEIVMPNELFSADQMSPLDADGYPTTLATVRDFYRL